ncbi:MAG: acyl-CoA thioesterase [Clostridiales bacterium]|nr:acyl-CoA thioesterase [Clostridiales bacterium]
MENNYKTPDQSLTIQVQIIMPEHINGADRLFGGQLIKWMDVVAGVAARRHSNHNITTACIDSLQFRSPAHLNDTVTITGKVTWAGRTSMEVKVEAHIEALDGTRTLANSAYFVMVALDENEKPTEVPKLLLRNDEERAEFDDAVRRREERMKHK